MGFETGPTQMESPGKQRLFDERLGYENQRQAAINKENSIRARYGAIEYKSQKPPEGGF